MRQLFLFLTVSCQLVNVKNAFKCTQKLDGHSVCIGGRAWSGSPHVQQVQLGQHRESEKQVGTKQEDTIETHLSFLRSQDRDQGKQPWRHKMPASESLLQTTEATR